MSPKTATILGDHSRPYIVNVFRDFSPFSVTKTATIVAENGVLGLCELVKCRITTGIFRQWHSTDLARIHIFADYLSEIKCKLPLKTTNEYRS